MLRGKRAGIFLIALLAVSAVIGGVYGPAVRARDTGTTSMEQAVETFSNVLAVVQHDYAKPLKVNTAVYDGAIPGMLGVLDPHSTFFDSKQFALLREDQNGRYFGVGMQIGAFGGRTVVIEPFPGSPAYKAGLRPGDVIVEVDGKSCKGLSTTEVANLLKGPRGTVVKVGVGREGWNKPLQFTITREEIPHPSVDYYTLLGPGIGYVHILTFESEDTADELAAAMKKLDAPRLQGLILDLRDNPGGLLNQAVKVADMFLAKGQLIVSHHGRNSPEQRYYALHGNDGNHVPVVVLVNGNTASASEIVSGALQDHDRGLIAGGTTFGKGLVQTVTQLSYGTGLALTTARYYTPSGRLIQRPYQNISYWEYRFDPRPAPKPKAYLTDSGRTVYGGGGITPDVKIPAAKLDPFQTKLILAGVFFPPMPDSPLEIGVGDFTRSFLGQRPTVTKDFTVDQGVIDALEQFLTRQHVSYTPQDIQENLDWLKWQIKREVFTSVFGADAGFKVDLEHDAQVQQAMTLIPQARSLYANARKVIAEHAALLGPAPATATAVTH